MGKVQLYYSTSIQRDVSVRKSVPKSSSREAFPGLTRTFLLRGGGEAFVL